MRTPIPAGLAAFALSVPPALLGGAPATTAAIFVEVNPSTVPAGDQVSLRAGCSDNLKSATVTAGPLGTVPVTPNHGFLTATVRVPATVRPGDYGVKLTCPGGQTATATLHVVAKVTPSRGPATGGGGTAPDRYAPALVGGGLVTVLGGGLIGLLAARRRRAG
jgi:hypothetical protein